MEWGLGKGSDPDQHKITTETELQLHVWMLHTVLQTSNLQSSCRCTQDGGLVSNQVNKYNNNGDKPGKPRCPFYGRRSRRCCRCREVETRGVVPTTSHEYRAHSTHDMYSITSHTSQSMTTSHVGIISIRGIIMKGLSQEESFQEISSHGRRLSQTGSFQEG